MPPTMMNTQQFPAGWYPTDRKGGLRYWDGVQWTAFQRAPRPKTWASAGALLFTLAILGVVLVWAIVVNA